MADTNPMNLGADPVESEAGAAALDRGDDYAPAAPTPAVAPPAVVDEPKATEPVVEAPKADDPPVETPAVDEPKAVEPPKSRNPMIPRARFDEVNERLRSAEAQLAALRAEREEQRTQRAASAEDGDKAYFALLEQHATAVAESDTAKILDTAKQLREIEHQRVRQEAQDVSGDMLERSAITAAIQSAAAVANVKFPEFDPASEVFNAEAVQEALDLFNSLYSGGKYAPGECLTRAAGYVAAMRGYKDRMVEPEAAPAAAPTAKPIDVAAKVAAATAQPPAVPTAAADPLAAYDVNTMSEKDFDSLPESVRRRLRGDVL